MNYIMVGDIYPVHVHIPIYFTYEVDRNKISLA